MSNKHKKIIHIFGNILLPFDSLPLKLQPELQAALPEIDFVISDPNENIKPVNKELVIIDTVLDIKEIKIIKNIDQIQDNQTYSMHDFDLGLNLKLLQKIGELEKITIFGVPPDMNKKIALKQLIKLIKAI
jgi:hypothetical protein